MKMQSPSVILASDRHGGTVYALVVGPFRGIARLGERRRGLDPRCAKPFANDRRLCTDRFEQFLVLWPQAHLCRAMHLANQF